MKTYSYYTVDNIINNTKLDGSLPVNIPYFDLRLGNLCQLKCIMCSPHDSSSWIKEWKAQYPKYKTIELKKDQGWDIDFDYTWYQKGAFLDDMRSNAYNIRELYFAGGEPLLIPEHYKILEHLISIGKTDIPIAYNTNFSRLTYKSHDVIELWRQFSDITVGASLDAKGNRAEYMRKGTVWADICANRERMIREVPHVKFMISSTVSAYNVMTITEFWDDWITRGWVDPLQIDVNMLLFPEHHRLQVLPEGLRNIAKDRIGEYIERWGILERDDNGRTSSGLLGLVRALDGSEKGWFKFCHKNVALDAIRGESFYTVFPEFMPYAL